MKPNDIICPMCGVVCGKFYPATDVDPGFREGIGEEFMDEFLNFHCSQSCLDAAVEYAIENRTCICHEGPDSVGTLRSCPVHGIPETDPLGLPRAYVVETMSSVPPEAQREIDKIVQASHDSGPHVVHDIFAGFMALSRIAQEVEKKEAENRRLRRNERARLRRKLSPPKPKVAPEPEQLYEPPTSCYCHMGHPPCGWCTREIEDADEDLCGLCGESGADKIPHPMHWPGEAIPDTPLVHAACEQAECKRAHALLSDKQRESLLRSI